MRSRVRFFPRLMPYGWHVEYKEDGWFQSWSQSGTYNNEAAALAAAKLFQKDQLIWDSQASGGGDANGR